MNRSQGMEDGEIIRRIVDGGDSDVFGLLLERYSTYVSSIVSKHVPPEEVPEVVHDIFVRAYQSLPKYRHEGKFDRWLSKIAVRTCHDFWRARYRSREKPVSDLSEDQKRWLENVSADDGETVIEDRLYISEAAVILDKAMETLSPGDRMVLELVHIEERSVRETAELMGWSIANVKVRAYRARHKLRRILGKMLDSQGGHL